MTALFAGTFYWISLADSADSAHKQFPRPFPGFLVMTRATWQLRLPCTELLKAYAGRRGGPLPKSGAYSRTMAITVVELAEGVKSFGVVIDIFVEPTLKGVKSVTT